MRIPLLLILVLAGLGEAQLYEGGGVYLHVDGPGGYLPDRVDASPVIGPMLAVHTPTVEISISTYGMDRPLGSEPLAPDWDALFLTIGEEEPSPSWMDLMSDLSRIGRGDLSLEEWVVVLGVGHGYNISREGVVTLGDGRQINISRYVF